MTMMIIRLPKQITVDGQKAYPVRAHNKAFRDHPIVKQAILAQRKLMVKGKNGKGMSGGWALKMRSVILPVLNSQVKECATRARKGLSPLPEDWNTRWAGKLYGAQVKVMTSIAIDGVEFAQRVVEMAGAKGKKFTDVEVGGTESFVLTNVNAPLEAWLTSVASGSTKTNANRIQQIYDNANSAWDEEKQQGPTHRDIANQILSEGLAKNRAHATNIAITNTQWAFNEGARREYIQAGVQALEWMTSKDEAVCPFCAAMDGQAVNAQDPFWDGGQTFGVEVLDRKGDAKIRTMNINQSVDHPPLHPHCACTLLPVLKEPPLPIQDADDINRQPVQPSMTNAAAQEVRKKLAAESERVEALKDKADKLNARDYARVEKKLDEYNAIVDAGALDQKTLDGLSKEMKAIISSMQRRVINDEKVMARYRKLLYSKKKSRFKITYRTRFGRKRKERIRAGMEEIRKMVSIPDLDEHRVYVRSWNGTRSRQANQALLLSKEARPHTVVHEMGHWIEDQVPDAHEKAVAFLQRRTANDTPMPLSIWDNQYGADEFTRPDKFKDPYMGKVYQNGADVYATEIISMGLEEMFVNPAEFATIDPDMFDFIFSLMKGL